jgi:hypothetical protein
VLRQRINLDGQWDFFIDHEHKLQPDSLDHANLPRPIFVPAPWQAQSDDLRNYTGVGWYRRYFSLAAPHPHERWYLCFGAVDYYATVWLNGTLLGDHEGGYLPFELAIDPELLRDTDNLLVVRVVDPGATSAHWPQFAFNEIPHGKQSWYGQISGIWQSVFLENRALIHVQQLRVTPNIEQHQAEVHIRYNQAVPQHTTVCLAVTDPHGQATAYDLAVDVGQTQTIVQLPVPEPLLWDTQNPHLYQLAATLTSGDGQTDTVTTSFGMRSIATNAHGQFLLNGQVLYLRGALDQDYYPQTMYTPWSDEQLDEQIALAKQMGLNCLRIHIKITDPRYYAAADRAGMLIWTELPNWETLTEAAKQRAHATLVGMVERDWNHPSIIIWTIINEGWGVDLAGNAEHRRWLADMYAFLKLLDPQRLIVGNSPCYTNFHVVTDIEDFHNYYAMPDHYRQWRDWVAVFASRPPWTFAQTYEHYDDWRAFLRDPWNPLMRQAAPETQRRGNEPMVISEFGTWGLPDVAALKERYGGEPWWFETGMEWAEGVVYPHGIEQRFRMYHLDRVFGTLSGLALASQRMQAIGLKYQIEHLRHYPTIQGYIITEFTDVHWECNGLLDLYRTPKIAFEMLQQVNGATAILSAWDRIVYWEGERCEVQVTLSYFASTALQHGRIDWHVDVWPHEHGSFALPQVLPGAVLPVGTVAFTIPQLTHSQRMRLHYTLYDAAGTQITANDHEIYGFPRILAMQTEDQPVPIYAEDAVADWLRTLGYTVTTDLAMAKVAIVAQLTDSVRWFLQGGGRVLWLAESNDDQQTYLGGIRIVQRQGRSWQGDWVSTLSWLRQETLFRDLPTEGLVDFAFANLIPESVIVGIPPRDFADHVHAGMFVGWLHATVALIVERTFAHGILLISTFRLRQQIPTNPVAAIMVRDLLNSLTQRHG